MQRTTGGAASSTRHPPINARLPHTSGMAFTTPKTRMRRHKQPRGHTDIRQARQASQHRQRKCGVVWCCGVLWCRRAWTYPCGVILRGQSRPYCHPTHALAAWLRAGGNSGVGPHAWWRPSHARTHARSVCQRWRLTAHGTVRRAGGGLGRRVAGSGWRVKADG